jgi:hypothetical protein
MTNIYVPRLLWAMKIKINVMFEVKTAHLLTNGWEGSKEGLEILSTMHAVSGRRL